MQPGAILASPMTYQITSPSNERIRRLMRLRERRHRDEEGVFILEGRRLLERAIASGRQPTEVYSDGTITQPWTEDVITVDPATLDRASYRRRSEGVIAVFEQFDVQLTGLGSPGSLTLAAEAIEKPGNLGAMLRTADAVGADAFVAIGSTIDPFNPNVLRASTGALFTVPIAVSELGEFIDWLGQVELVAAVPGSPSPYWDADLAGDTALIVGSEAVGLSEAAIEAAAHKVSIPMGGVTDSLNASVSLALLAYEAVRQRFTTHA
jgi:TrmH family RNA methyltransferase